MALQLVEFRRPSTTEDRNHTKIQINEENLDKVLKACGDRPICVICICGPSRRGKSFILGHMIRCLEATENNHGDWMDLKNPTKPLGPGFSWRNGYNPITKGIWIWEKPFILPSADNTKCAVLLMDTQGTYDEFTSSRDMASTVGLSLLLSSVMIFNFFTNLGEDILDSLGTYIEYGLLALKNDDSDEKPFQNLKFLIRDWNNPSQFPYGKSGGSKFINKKLEVKDHQPESAKTVRRKIKKCFERVSCFLMPPIGEEAKKEGFDGNIEDLDICFRDNMHQFINKLVEEDLAVKNILGIDVTAKTLRNYMQIYVKAFNESSIPTPASIWEATALAANNNTVEKSQKIFQDEMNKQKKGRMYFNPDAFTEAAKVSKQTALNFFNATKIYGDAGSTFRSKLDNFLRKEMEFNKASNDRRRTTILQDATDAAEEAFDKTFLSKYFLDDDETIWDEKSIDVDAKMTKLSVLQDFEDALEEETDDEKREKIKAFENSLDEKIRSVKTQNLYKIGRAQEIVRNNVESLVRTYSNSMKEMMANQEIVTIDSLRKRSEAEKSEIFAEFVAKKTKGNPEFFQKFYDQLSENINNEWESIRNSFEVIQKHITNEAENWIAKIAREYKRELDTATKEKMLTNETIDIMTSGHEEDVMAFHLRFEEECSAAWQSDDKERLLSKLDDELEMIFNHAKEKVKDFNKKLQEKCSGAVKTLKKWYKAEIKKAVEKNLYMSKDALRAEHERLENIAVQKLAENTNGMDQDSIYERKLRDKLEIAFQNIQEQNQLQMDRAIWIAKTEINDCLSEYKKAMTSLQKTYFGENDKGNLEISHKTAKHDAVERFNSSLKLPDEDFNNFFTELSSAIEDAFQEIQTSLLERKAALEDSVQRGLDKYITEMQIFLENDKHPNMVQIRRQSENLISQILGSFDQFELDQETWETFLKKMKNEWEKIETKIRKDWEKNVLENIETLVKHYKGEMKIFLDGKDVLTEPDFKKEHQRLKIRASGTLKQTTYGLENLDEFICALESAIDSCFGEFELQKHQRQRDLKNPPISKTLDEASIILTASMFFEVSVDKIGVGSMTTPGKIPGFGKKSLDLSVRRYPAQVAMTNDGEWVCGDVMTILSEDDIQRTYRLSQCVNTDLLTSKDEPELQNFHAFAKMSLCFLLGIIFKFMKQNAELDKDEKFSTVLISVPFWFTSFQRTQVIEAAQITGFKSIRLVNENSSAAYFAYAETEVISKSQEHLVVVSANSDYVDISIYNFDEETGKCSMRGHAGNYITTDKSKVTWELCYSNTCQAEVLSNLKTSWNIARTSIKKFDLSSEEKGIFVLICCDNDSHRGVLFDLADVITTKDKVFTRNSSPIFELSVLHMQACLKGLNSFEQLLCDGMPFNVTSTDKKTIAVNKNDTLGDFHPFCIKLPYDCKIVELFDDQDQISPFIKLYFIQRFVSAAGLEVVLKRTQDGIFMLDSISYNELGQRKLLQNTSVDCQPFGHSKEQLVTYKTTLDQIIVKSPSGGFAENYVSKIKHQAESISKSIEEDLKKFVDDSYDATFRFSTKKQQKRQHELNQKHLLLQQQEKPLIPKLPKLIQNLQTYQQNIDYYTGRPEFSSHLMRDREKHMQIQRQHAILQKQKNQLNEQQKHVKQQQQKLQNEQKQHIGQLLQNVNDIRKALIQHPIPLELLDECNIMIKTISLE